jgi:hypothetical protein
MAIGRQYPDWCCGRAQAHCFRPVGRVGSSGWLRYLMRERFDHSRRAPERADIASDERDAV